MLKVIEFGSRHHNNRRIRRAHNQLRIPATGKKSKVRGIHWTEGEHKFNLSRACKLDNAIMRNRNIHMGRKEQSRLDSMMCNGFGSVVAKSSQVS